MGIRTPPPVFHYQHFFIDSASAISAVPDLPTVPVLPSVSAAPASRRSQSLVQITLLSSLRLLWRCETAGWKFPSALCQGRKLLCPHPGVFKKFHRRAAMHPITYLVDGTVLPPCYVCSIFLLSSVFQHSMCEKSFLSYFGVTSVKKCKFMGYKTCVNKN